jgi:NAD(P)-dependent dehydrogenase (short-subunit alcohol dehydrogenase family)
VNVKLANKVALITGGAQGLGKVTALAMANEGAKVVICDINPKTYIKATNIRPWK